jgi:hypothetical protein
MAQIESDDVAAVRVLRTGETDMSARKMRIEDFSVLTPARKKVSIEKF